MTIRPMTPPEFVPVHDQDCAGLLEEAEVLRVRGKFVEALVVFEKVLTISPESVRALNGKGVSLKELGRPDEAMACYESALVVDPNNWYAHNNRGVVLKQFGLFEESFSAYKRALALCDSESDGATTVRLNIAVVLNEIGMRLKLAGSIDDARSRFKQAIIFAPDHDLSHFNLAVIAAECGDVDEALRLYGEALRCNPCYVEAICNIGVLKKNRNDIRGAIRLYERALALNPNHDVTRTNLAIALTDLGTFVKPQSLCESISLYRKALVFNSKYAQAWYNLGVALVDSQSVDEAVVAYEIALMLNPMCFEAHNNLGVIVKDQGNLARSIQHYQAALAVNPMFPQTLNNLGVIYTMMGQVDDAEKCCLNAIQADPSYAEVHNNLGVLRRDEGRIRESVAAYEQCIALDPNSRNARHNRLLAINYIDEYSDDFVYEQHVAWGTREVELCEQFTEFPSLKGFSERRLRIGYVSPDFVTHSVSYFIDAPLRCASDSVEIVCYNNSGRVDDKTQLLMSYGHTWRDIHGRSAEDVAAMVRADGIDILVDLTGHTAFNRLDVFAMRPAPVQVTWIGYPNTTGLSTIDYRFTDEVVDPIFTKQKFSEELVRLPGCFLCYSPPKNYPDVLPLPALTNRFVTFGSLNNLAKITPAVIALWSRILRQVPTSRMLLKCKPFASTSVCERVLKAFEANAVDRKRIDLLPLIPSTSGHLEIYRNVDIALDSFPYAGTTTTCESLLMAVPVVTLKGSNHAHNVGATLLSRVKGLESFITCTEDDYVDAAVSFASNLPALSSIHDSLRSQFLESDLCDAKSFCMSLESTFASLIKKVVDNV